MKKNSHNGLMRKKSIFSIGYALFLFMYVCGYEKFYFSEVHIKIDYKNFNM